MQLWQPTRGILQPNQHWRRGQGVVAAATTTLNPADKTSTITLSNSDLTATVNAATGSPQARTIAFRNSGKRYCELTISARINSASENMSFGILSASHTIGSTYLGGNTFGFAFWPTSNTHNIYFNGATTNFGVMSTGAAGIIYAMAVDFDVSPVRAWWRNVSAGGNWNNNVANDPTTPATGYGQATLAGSPWAIAVEADVLNYAWTLNAGATAYAGAVPVGYVDW